MKKDRKERNVIMWILEIQKTIEIGLYGVKSENTEPGFIQPNR